MAITSYSQQRLGNATVVTVVSGLSGTIYYHWYLDGSLVASTEVPTWTFFVEAAEQLRVEVKDTNDPDYDTVANAPAGYPARRTLEWVRSLDTTTDRYRIEQRLDAGSWTTIGLMPVDSTAWTYRWLTPRLTDLGSYEWRVVPQDAAGNDGTALALDAETVVRTPDAPDFTATFDSGTTKVTFAAA